VTLSRGQVESFRCLNSGTGVLYNITSTTFCGSKEITGQSRSKGRRKGHHFYIGRWEGHVEKHQL
jgi:hypothetical protein